ncbi:hypothetical protein SDC9_148919 [bioreactor metagenome]|uniref:Uncharacterized protein n=1 Tax=bioreactor metagenome TaxID=1076179 RepID=A0A645EI77_9ZZZZ
MNGHERRAALLADAGELRRVHVRRVPALSKLHTHRHMRAVDHRLDDASRERQVEHQGAAVAIACDLWRGAAHVEINESQLPAEIVLQNRNRVGQRLRLAAKELHAKRRILRLCKIQRPGLLAFVAQALGADHFGCDEIRPVFQTELAKRAIRKPRHRSEAEGGTSRR